MNPLRMGRNRRGFGLCRWVGLLAACWAMAGDGMMPGWQARAEALKVGMAVEDITPPPGWRMSGYFHERLSTGKHDPLQAKVTVWQQGEVRAALVLADLIGIPVKVSSRVREEASFRTGISMDHIVVAATHTHTGPLYYGVLREHFHRQAVAEHGHDPVEWVDYTAILIDRMVGAIVRAQLNMSEAQLQIASPKNYQVSFNRRFHMRDGRVVFNPGKQNPDILHAAGPVDPEVHVLAIQGADGKSIRGILTAFALHLDTVGGTEYSADFPHHLENALRRLFGPDMIGFFAAAPCGDINHIDVSHRRPQKGQAEARRIGYALAETITEAWSQFHPVNRASLALRHETVRVQLQEFTEEEEQWARETVASIGDPGVTRPFLETVRACTIVDLAGRGSDAVSLPVHVWRLGEETAMVFLPGEVFVDLGLAIKRNSPFHHTIVVELCQDAIAYVPTRKAFEEGSYEIVNSRIQPGGGEDLVEAALCMLRELKP